MDGNVSTNMIHPETSSIQCVPLGTTYEQSSGNCFIYQVAHKDAKQYIKQIMTRL
jgi:hypothetical protein